MGVSPSGSLASRYRDLLVSNLQEEKPSVRKQECECYRPCTNSSDSPHHIPCHENLQHISKGLFNSKILLFLPASCPHRDTTQFFGNIPVRQTRAQSKVGDRWLSRCKLLKLSCFVLFPPRSSWPVLIFYRLYLIKKELLSTTLFQFPTQWLSELHSNTNFRKR